MRLNPRAPKCRHGQTICPQCIEISDAAKRMADVINGLVTFNQWDALRNSWVAIRLADGDFDGNLYATREEAIKYQADERHCAYAWMGNFLQGAKPLDCAIYLEFHRQAYDAGMRLHEPDAPQLIVPTMAYDRMTGRGARPGPGAGNGPPFGPVRSVLTWPDSRRELASGKAT